jgi:hypothetical protein
MMDERKGGGGSMLKRRRVIGMGKGRWWGLLLGDLVKGEREEGEWVGNWS